MKVQLLGTQFVSTVLPNMFLTDSLLSDLVGLLVALLVMLTGYFKWTYQYWQRKNVPYLNPTIPFGNLSLAIRGKEQVGVLYSKIYKEMKSKGWKHGGIYIFSDPCYVPIDLDLVRNIMTKDFQYFTDRKMYHNEKDPLQAHLLNLTGNKWKNLRAKLTPTFSSGKIKMMFQAMADCEGLLHKKMDEEILKKEPINIKEILARFTTNIIGSCAFGLDFKALEDDDSPFRALGRRLFKRTCWSSFKNQFALTFPNVAKFLKVSLSRREITDFVLNMVEDIIYYREKNNTTRNDFMQMMISLKNKPDSGDHDGKPLSLDEVASQCFVFFAAGFETSSTLMTFTLYELAKNQDIQDKLRKEIREVLQQHDNKITYDAIQDIKYLNQVIDESLRLHPPSPATNRTCVQNYKIPGEDVIIEKGTTVAVPILGIHLDEEYHPNPTKFDPERFSDANRSKLHNFAHMPFGGGPRHCIGMRFGLLQSKMGLVASLKNYNFSVNSKTKEPITYQPNGAFLAVEGEVWLNAEKA